MKELLGEPVAEADVVYRSEREASDRSLNRCWRYYYLESFWDMRLE